MCFGVSSSKRTHLKFHMVNRENLLKQNLNEVQPNPGSSQARSKWEDVSDNIHKETVTNMTKANESSSNKIAI